MIGSGRAVEHKISRQVGADCGGFGRQMGELLLFVEAKSL